MRAGLHNIHYGKPKGLHNTALRQPYYVNRAAASNFDHEGAAKAAAAAISQELGATKFISCQILKFYKIHDIIYIESEGEILLAPKKIQKKSQLKFEKPQNL